MPCNMSHAILVAVTACRSAVATADLNSCKWYKHPENLKNYKTASTSIKRCTQLSAYVIGLCLHFFLLCNLKINLLPVRSNLTAIIFFTVRPSVRLSDGLASTRIDLSTLWWLRPTAARANRPRAYAYPWHAVTSFRPMVFYSRDRG